MFHDEAVGPSKADKGLCGRQHPDRERIQEVDESNITFQRYHACMAPAIALAIIAYFKQSHFSSLDLGHLFSISTSVKEGNDNDENCEIRPYDSRLLVCMARSECG